MFDKVVSIFIENTIIGSLLVLAVFLFSAILKKSKIFDVRYWIWLLIAIRIIIPFKIQLPVSYLKIAGTVTDRIPEVFNIPYIPENFNNIIISGQENMSNPNFFEIIKIVWLIGLIVYAAYYICCYIFIRISFKKSSTTINDNKIINIFNNISENLGIIHKPEIMFSEKTISPLMIGFFKPLLILPERHYSDEDLNMIIKHELTHIRRRDNWYKLLMIIAKAPHWFNPLIHLMTNSADNDMELCCDNEVIKNENIEYKKNYSSLIVSYISINGSKNPHGSAVYLLHNKKFIKERIDCMFKKSSLNKKITVFVLLLFTIIVASSFAYSESIQDLDNIKDNNSILVTSKSTNNRKYIKPVDSSNIVVVDEKYIIFVTEKGTDVSAIYDGFVDSAGYHYSFGNYVKIKGSDEIDIIYCHLENINVSEKQDIKKGQKIGTSGNSGYTSIDACGIRAYIGEEKVDIKDYINFTENDKVVNIDNLSYIESNKETLFEQ